MLTLWDRLPTDLLVCPGCDGSGLQHSHNPICGDCGGTGRVTPDQAAAIRELQQRIARIPARWEV